MDTRIDRRLLGIYLNDHLSGSIAGVELAKRSAASNEGTDLGRFLEGLVGAIDDDRAALEEIMRRLDIKQNPVKKLAAWTAEKAGRGKLNGRILGYSALSRLIELEGLSIGIEGKRLLWHSLRTLGEEASVAGIDLDELIARAERQREGLEEHRKAAAARALAG